MNRTLYRGNTSPGAHTGHFTGGFQNIIQGTYKPRSPHRAFHWGFSEHYTGDIQAQEPTQGISPGVFRTLYRGHTSPGAHTGHFTGVFSRQSKIQTALSL